MVPLQLFLTLCIASASRDLDSELSSMLASSASDIVDTSNASINAASMCQSLDQLRTKCAEEDDDSACHQYIGFIDVSKGSSMFGECLPEQVQKLRELPLTFIRAVNFFKPLIDYPGVKPSVDIQDLLLNAVAEGLHEFVAKLPDLGDTTAFRILHGCLSNRGNVGPYLERIRAVAAREITATVDAETAKETFWSDFTCSSRTAADFLIYSKPELLTLNNLMEKRIPLSGRLRPGQSQRLQCSSVAGTKCPDPNGCVTGFFEVQCSMKSRELRDTEMMTLKKLSWECAQCDHKACDVSPDGAKCCKKPMFRSCSCD